jgi:hypothetical protein
MYKLLGRLLEYNEGEFEGNKYSNVVVRYEGQLLKFKLDRKQVADCKEKVDTDVELTFEVQKGQNSSASIRVVAVSEV